MNNASKEARHEILREQVLREHEKLKDRIQTETGCAAIEAGLQAWVLMFAREIEEPVML